MGYSINRAAYEAALAAAHRALWRAGIAAEQLGDEGAAQDVDQLLKEVTRLAEASLKGKANARSVLSGQTSLC